MERILVPLDGSSLGEFILPVAELLARHQNVELIFLRAVVARPVVLEGEVHEIQMETTGEVMEYLKGIADRFRGNGLAAKWALWHEEPVTAIAKAVKEERVDLIAMATHGRSGLSRLLVGSVAAQVVRETEVPVLLVRGRLARESWSRRRILVALDGGEAAEAILSVVERFGSPRDSTIALLTVIEPLPSLVYAESPFRVDEMIALRRDDAERYLGKVAEPLRANGWRVETQVRFGRVAETIGDFARQAEAGMIAMVTHGRHGLGRFFLGSVAEEVLRRSSIPVLLVKGEER